MTDSRGLLALDAPAVDKARFRGRTGAARPVDPPSLWNQFATAARGAAGNDDPAAAEARQREAIDAGLAPIVAELERRDVQVGEYSARRARDGFAVSYDEGAIWQGIARARALDPKAFDGVEASPDLFRKRVTAPVVARIADEQDTTARSSWVPWLAGQFVGGASDPINQAAMLVGAGPARSIAQAALRDAQVNVVTEAVQEPVRVIAAAKRGNATTIAEVATDLTLAAGTGAVFGGLVHGAGDLVAKRAKTPAGQLADRMRETIGVDRMTDAERTAVATLDRVDEVSATSPYQPGAGTNVHLARVDAATTALAKGEPLPPPPAARFDRKEYDTRLAKAESGGRWQVQAETSSAYGLYQITRGTFLRYAKQMPGNRTMSDDAIWALRTNPAMQEGVKNRLNADNRAALAQIGVPETYGNMYLLHFAGEGGGSKILRADPDTPIGALMSAKAIDANPFLRGKTAGDVVAWAHKKMDDPLHAGAVLKREVFESDDAWASAQREVDAVDAEIAARQAAEAASTRSPIETDWGDDAMPGFDEPAIAADVVPVGSDWEPGPARASDDLTPESVSTPAGSSPAFEQVASTVRADAVGDAAISPISVRERGEPGYHIEPDAEGHMVNAVFRDEDGVARGAVLFPASDEVRAFRRDSGQPVDVVTYVDPAFRRQGVATRLYDQLRDAGYDVDSLSGTSDLTPNGAAFVNARRASLAEQRASVADRIDADARATQADAGPLPPVAEEPLPIVGFDHPDDVAAVRQTESLEHDLRMFLLEQDAEGLTVRLDDEGDVVSAADALQGLDDDEAAIAAARACMVPPDNEVPF